MKIPVVFRDGTEQTVTREELQFLMATKQVMFFKRSDGWVVVGRDKMRSQKTSFSGKERRKHGIFSKEYWY